MSQLRAILAACLGALALLAASSTAQTQPAPAERPALGVVLPLSGKHKRLGEPTLDAINLARAAAPGVDVVVLDSAGDEDQARAAIARLAADPRILAILGPIGWKESRAAAAEADRRGVPLIALSNEQGLEDLSPWVFRGRPSVEEQARTIGAFGVGSLQVRHFAILYPDDELGQAAALAFFEQVRAGGGLVMAIASYTRSDTNMTQAVEELVGLRLPRLEGHKRTAPPRAKRRKAGGAPNVDFEALFIPDYDDNVALLVKFLRFVEVPLAGYGDGSSIQLLGISHMAGPHLANAEGLTTGAVLTDLFDPGDTGRDEAIDAFTRDYRDAWRRDPTDLDAQTADLLLRLIDAVQQGRTREGTRARLLAAEPWTGLTGKQWFEPDGAPGHALGLWVVGPSGEVTPTDP